MAQIPEQDIEQAMLIGECIDIALASLADKRSITTDEVVDRAFPMVREFMHEGITDHDLRSDLRGIVSERLWNAQPSLQEVRTIIQRRGGH
jgi:hypothetical protein